MSHATDCLARSIEDAWNWLVETHRDQHTGRWTEHTFWVTQRGRVLRDTQVGNYPNTRMWKVGTYTRLVGLEEFRNRVFLVFEKQGRVA